MSVGRVSRTELALMFKNGGYAHRAEYFIYDSDSFIADVGGGNTENAQSGQLISHSYV